MSLDSILGSREGNELSKIRTEDGGGDGGAGEAGDVFEAGFGPVVDDEEGEEGGADGVEPPEVELVAEEGKEEGEGIEDDVGLAV